MLLQNKFNSIDAYIKKENGETINGKVIGITDDILFYYGNQEIKYTCDIPCAIFQPDNDCIPLVLPFNEIFAAADKNRFIFNYYFKTLQELLCVVHKFYIDNIISLDEYRCFLHMLLSEDWKSAITLIKCFFYLLKNELQNSDCEEIKRKLQNIVQTANYIDCLNII